MDAEADEMPAAILGPFTSSAIAIAIAYPSHHPRFARFSSPQRMKRVQLSREQLWQLQVAILSHLTQIRRMHAFCPCCRPLLSLTRC